MQKGGTVQPKTDKAFWNAINVHTLPCSVVISELDLFDVAVCSFLSGVSCLLKRSKQTQEWYFYYGFYQS